MKLNQERRSREIRGNVDRVTSEAIEGWIAEYRDGALAGSRQVSLVVDGHQLVTVSADVQRRDLGESFSGDDRCGFQIPLSLGVRERFGGKEFRVVDVATGQEMPMPALHLPTLERLFLDVGDTLIYFSHHSTASGIQRVVTELSRVLHRKRSDSLQLVAGHPDGSGFREVQWHKWEALLDALETSPEDAGVLARAMMEAAFDHAKRRVVPQGAILLSLGSPWISSEYVASLLDFRARGGRVIGLVYDLIPIRLPEAFDSNTRLRFERVMCAFALACEHVAAISDFSRLDFEGFCGEQGLKCPPTSTLRLASSIGVARNDEVESHSWDEYVLLVSTIEGRKGHRLALNTWRRLLSEGPVDQVPQLVFVGRPGWRSRELFEELAASNYLGGKVSVVTKVEDSRLLSLYRDALFTLYPSSYEGWGLPVGESIAAGTPVIASDASSIPEVAADFVRYFPSGDREALYDAVSGWISDRKELAKWRQRTTEYVPETWETVCARLLSVVDECTSIATASQAPTLPAAFEVQMTLAHHDADSDDFVSVSWEQEYLHATPILGQSSSPSREVIGSLCLRGDAVLIPMEGRLLRIGRDATLRFVTPVSSFDLYIALEVVGGRHPESDEAIGTNEESTGKSVVLLHIDGDVTPVNAWVSGRRVVKVHGDGRADRGVSLSLEVLAGPATSPNVEGIVIRSVVLIPEEDDRSRWLALERAAGMV